MKKLMTGKQALLEMLKIEEVEYIFGNPGTSEAPFIDLLGDYPEFKYILTLQESVAVGMGESYARATGETSFVSLHVDSGLANGIALMLDALNSGTPMVITSANYDARKINESKTDLADLVRPVTKWSVELNLPDQIPGALRRAFNEANSYPKGPVYVGFTANALEGVAEMDILPSKKAYATTYPDPNGVEQAAKMIANATNPVLIVGDRVSDDDALGSAVEFADSLGLPIYQYGGAEVSFPTTHPQYMGILSLRLLSDRIRLKDFDVIIAVGLDAFEDIFYWGNKILPSSAKLIHIDPIAGRVGRSEPTDVGIISNCKTALDKLNKQMHGKIPQSVIDRRRDEIKKEVCLKRTTYEESVRIGWDETPMSAARMMYELSESMPSNAIIVDDAVSNRGALRHYFNATKKGDIRGIRGGSIGGGIGATMGAQCANPDRPVFGIIGDGSAMMTIQGLWTAANDNIPCIFVICNNGMYRVLKVNFNIYQKDILGETEPAGASLPYSDFPSPFNVAAIANSMGVNSERILNPEDIGPAVDRALKEKKPYLLDIVIDGSL